MKRHNKLIRFTMLFLLLILFSSQVLAEEKQEETSQLSSMLAMNLEELVDLEVVTVTGISKPINLAPAVASVITAEEIERIGATTLDEVLETVPGLHVYPSNVNSMASGFSIRGIQTRMNPEILLLVNSIPITFSYTGARIATFKMPVAYISRVEVVRGPGSAIHGADAFSGTINVITKDGTEIDGTKAGVRYGSFDTTDVWLQHGQYYGGWDVAVSLEYKESRGDNNRVVESDLQASLDGLFGTSATHAPGELDTDYELFDGHLSLAKDNWTLRTWAYLQPETPLGVGVTDVLTPEGRSELAQFLSDITYQNKNLLEDVDLSLRLSHLYIEAEHQVELFPDGATVTIGSDGNLFTGANVAVFPDGILGNPSQYEKQTAVDLSFLYEGVKQHLLRLGTGYKHIGIEAEESKNFGLGVLDNPPAFSIVDGTLTDVTNTPNIYMPDKTRNVSYVSIQDAWSFASDFELTGGVRYDYYSDFGSTTNPRIALVWETRYDLTSKLMYGRAFRAPAFTELYSQNNPANEGNKDLDPETIDFYELAFNYQPTNTMDLVFSSFIYEIDGLIELVNGKYQNYKDQKGHGVELELDWLPTNSVRLRSNFSYQRSEDKATGEIVPDAPEMQFYASGHWSFMQDWSLNGQYYWIANRHRAETDTRSDIKDNDIVNLTMRRKNIGNNWDISLAVRNVFDEDVREPSSSSLSNDFPMETRAVWAEVRAHF